MKRRNLKFVCLMLIAIMMFLTINPVWAVEEFNGDYSFGSDNGIKPVDVSDENYISFKEYVDKYGEENIRRTFAELDKINGSTEEGDKFDMLASGEFFGMKVLGILDVAPDNPALFIKVDSEDLSFPTPPQPVESMESVDSKNEFQEINGYVNSLERLKNIFAWTGTGGSSSLSPSVVPYPSKPPYVVHYYNPTYTPNIQNVETEANKGAYYYKYSLGFQGFYGCSTNVEFTNTNLKFVNTYIPELYISQKPNGFIFLTALSSRGAMDFGFLATSNYEGMRPVYNYTNFENASKSYGYVAPFTAVNGKNTSDVLTINNNQQRKIILSVVGDVVEMYIYNGSSLIYWLTYDTEEMIKFNNYSTPYYDTYTNPKGNQATNTLTFVQGMSLITDGTTNVDGGSSFNNVTFFDNKLHNADWSTPNFSSRSPSYTYYTLLNWKVNSSNNSNYIRYNDYSTGDEETLSIVY
jgi:hypothetical protein